MTIHPLLRAGIILAVFTTLCIGAVRLLGGGEPDLPDEKPDSSLSSDHPGFIRTIEKRYPNSQVDGYNLYIPKSLDSLSDPYPLIVFLQGGYGVGGDVADILQWELPAELVDGRAPDPILKSLKYDSFVYLMPHISTGEYYFNVSAFRQMLKEVQDQYHIDANRVYLTGLSRGGHGTWGVASKMPEQFAAIAPIAGGGHGVTDYEPLADLPIWVAHNKLDESVLYDRSYSIVKRLERISGDTFHRTETIASADYLNQDRIFTSGSNPTFQHDAWTEVYNSPAFYKWLLRFER